VPHGQRDADQKYGSSYLFLSTTKDRRWQSGDAVIVRQFRSISQYRSDGARRQVRAISVGGRGRPRGRQGHARDRTKLDPGRGSGGRSVPVRRGFNRRGACGDAICGRRRRGGETPKRVASLAFGL
jgi:hypothetical protein